jgi:hypothetical protein
MHCIELAELASLMAYQSPALFMMRPAVSHDSLNRYWIQSRLRLEQWHRWLGEYATLESARRPVAMQAWWNQHTSLLEEVLVSETLVRVFAGVGAGLDAVHDQREIEPVTHSVFLSHLEARNRVLQLMLFGRGGSITQTMQLNRLRRACERWTDRLLAPIVAHHPGAHVYCVDAARANAHASEWREESCADALSMSAVLARVAMQTTLAARTGTQPAMPLANLEIAQSVMACFNAECFDSVGMPRSLSRVRIQNSTVADRRPIHIKQIFPTVIPNDLQRSTLPLAARWLI